MLLLPEKSFTGYLPLGHYIFEAINLPRSTQVLVLLFYDLHTTLQTELAFLHVYIIFFLCADSILFSWGEFSRQ